MKKQRVWQAVLTAGLVLGLSTPANAMTFINQKLSALTASSAHNTRILNDKNVHYINVPRRYLHVKLGRENNVVKATQGARVTFKTKYLLPQPGYRNQPWGNPQSMAVVGRYIYVIYCPIKWHNRGRIVRYDQRKLTELAATPKEVQGAYSPTAGPAEKRVRQAIKIGKPFITGHGQSLAFNRRDHQLYMWRDTESAPRVPTTLDGVILRINQKRLQPDRQYRFRLRGRSFTPHGGHVLAFDKRGKAYFWTRPSKYHVYIYRGTIYAHRVKFQLTRQVLKQGPGTRVQSMAYNPKNDRLYLVADGSIASLPASKVTGRGRLTTRDVKWSKLTPNREFEGLDFASDGRAYLICNHFPEILTSTTTNW